MRIAVAASPAAAIPTLEALLESTHQLVKVISQPDRQSGRGKVLTPTPVSQWAIDHGIDLVRPEGRAEIAAAVQDCECVITIGYGVLLPVDILEIPPHGFLNLHFSILPRWRGAAPVQRAIEAGDQVSGVTVFQLDEGMDTGPIYTIHRFALDSDITSDDLLMELGDLGVGAILETLEKIAQGERPTPQKSDGVTLAKKLSRSEALIDWNQPAEIVGTKIRAFTSNPGAWTHFRGAALKIASPHIPTQVENEAENVKLNPGEIAMVGKVLFIGTATRAIAVGEVTPPGKQKMAAVAWANGARLTSGELCE